MHLAEAVLYNLCFARYDLLIGAFVFTYLESFRFV